MAIFDANDIILDLPGSNKEEILVAITKQIVNLGYVDSEQELLQAFKKREAEVTTGLENGFCIPHVRENFIKEVKIFYFRFHQAIDWPSIDNQKTQHAIVLMVPKNIEKIHIDLISKVAIFLMNKDFVTKLKETENKETIHKLINNVFENKNEEKSEEFSNNIVGITSCPAGIAHTYMAKEKLVEAGLKKGYKIKIETRGAIVENKLTSTDIKEAKFVIIAADVTIDKSIFNGKKVFEVSTIEAIKNPDEVLAKAEANQTVFYSSSSSTQEALETTTKTKMSRSQKKEEKKKILELKKNYKQTKTQNNSLIKSAKSELKKEVSDFENLPKTKLLKTEYKNQKTLFKGVFVKIKNEIKEKKHKLKLEKRNLINNLNFSNKELLIEGKKKISIEYNKKFQDLNLQLNRAWKEYHENVQNLTYSLELKSIKSKIDLKIMQLQQKNKDAFQNYYDTLQNFNNKLNRTFSKAIFSSIGYLIPIIILGGLFVAFGSLGTRIIVDPQTGSQQWITPPFANAMKSLGGAILRLIPAFLAMYIAKTIGGKAALAPAFIGGFLIGDSEIMSQLLLFDPNKVIEGVSVDKSIVNGGFLGGILIGYLAGYISKGISMLNFPSKLRPIIGLLFNPLITLLIVFTMVAFLIGTPVIFLTVLIYAGLFKLTEFNNVGVNILISIIFAVMINTDFGGPINKVAFFLSGSIAITSLQANNGDISKSNYLAQNAVQASIALAPLGVWIATLLFPYKFSKAEKISGNSALIMGLFGISEGALPFVFARPKKVILSSMFGSVIVGILIGLLSTYNNAKFVAGLGSPIGAWVGYAPGTGYGFIWFLIVIAGALVVGVSFGLSVETNEIIVEEHKMNKILIKQSLEKLGYVTWSQILLYKTKLIKNKIKEKAVKLRDINTYINRG